MMQPKPAQQHHSTSLTPPLVLAGGFLLAVGVVASLHSSLSPMLTVAAVVLKLKAFIPPMAYIASGFGFGQLLHPLLHNCSDRDRSWLELVGGLALVLMMDQLLGIVGLLTPTTAIGLTAIGLALAAYRGVRWATQHAARHPSSENNRKEHISERRKTWWWLWLIGIPAVALMVVASLMPPGWLWASEFGGYDALSYHLDLPQQWLRMGRIVPLESNVYSFLPNYLEGAFVHIALISHAPPEMGLLAGDGWRLLSCQLLEACFAFIAAGLVGRTVTQLTHRFDLSPRASQLGSIFAWALMLSTPWAVVTGTLAYNEGAVNAMLAAGMLVCVQPNLGFVRQCALAGVFVGAAISLKMTSVFFIAPVIGCLLIVSLWRQQCNDADSPGFPALLKGVLIGSLMTLTVMMPWLWRNVALSGNPVFPFAAGIFGTRHWTSEQLSRFLTAHHETSSFLERVRLLLWSDPNASANAPAVERFRGFANPQWGVFLPAVIMACLVLARIMVSKTGTAIGKQRVWVYGLWVAMVLQVLAWLLLTHAQSRFLLPMLPTGSVVVGLALAVSAEYTSNNNTPMKGWIAAATGVMLILLQTLFLFGIYGQEHQTGPGGISQVGQAILWPPEIMTGRLDENPTNTAVGWVNTMASPQERVYLEGDATGLYFGPNAITHTTWDRSLLGELAKQHPDDVQGLATELRKRKIGWILVNPGEIDRLERSGWYDPMVTSRFVHDLAEQLGGSARVWPDEGRYLVRVPVDNEHAGESQP